MSQGVRKGSIYALIGQGSAGVFLALFDIFAGRWLSVEQYGLLKVLYDLIFFSTVIVVAGVMENLSRNIAHFEARKENKNIKQTIQSSLTIYLITLILLLVLILFFKNWFTNKFFNSQGIMLVQFILGISILSIYHFHQGIFLGYRKFHIFSFGIGAKEFLTLAFLYIIIKIWNKSALEAGWSIVLSPILIIFTLAIILYFKSPQINIEWSNIFKNIKKNNIFFSILKFVLTTKFIFIMNQCILRLGPPILKIIATENPDYYAGIYSAITMPLKLTRTILVALCTGLLPNLTRAYSEKNEEKIKRYVYKSLGLFASITAAVTFVYYFFGPEIIELIYGEGFLVQRNQTMLLAFAMSFFFMGTLMANIMIARGTPKISAISLSIGLASMLILIIFFQKSLPPINVLGIALLICNFIYFSLQSIFFLILRINKKTNKTIQK
jgi:O-antigen/teichoic acid export membrane protein